MKIKDLKCAVCSHGDGEFPFTLYGETGKIIRYNHSKYPEYRHKVVCYNCWNILVDGKDCHDKIWDPRKNPGNFGRDCYGNIVQSKTVIRWNEDGSMKI